MASVNAEVQSIIKDIRDFGFEVEIGGKHAKVYKRGVPVLLEGKSGAPVTLPLTPSDSRWRDNLIGQLRRAKVVPKDYGRAPAPPRRPINGTETLVLKNAIRTAESEKRREERVDPLRKRMLTILETLGSKKVEIIELAFEVAEKRDLKTPKNAKSAATQLSELLRGAPKGMTAATLDFWEAVCDELDGTTREEMELKAKQAEEERQEAEKAKVEKIGPLHGDTLFRCEVEGCGAEFETKQQLGKHGPSHRIVTCEVEGCDHGEDGGPWVGTATRLGQHRRWKHPGIGLLNPRTPKPIPPAQPVPPVVPPPNGANGVFPDFLPVLWESIGALRGHGEIDLAEKLKEFARHPTTKVG